MKLHLLYYCYWKKTSKVGRALKKTYRPMAEALFLLPGTGICSSFRTMTVRLSSWKADFEKAFGKITMSPRNTTKIWGMASIRSTSKWMEKPCPMFA